VCWAGSSWLPGSSPLKLALKPLPLVRLLLVLQLRLPALLLLTSWAHRLRDRVIGKCQGQLPVQQLAVQGGALSALLLRMCAAPHAT
jgi:hypothetical protein